MEGPGEALRHVVVTLRHDLDRLSDARGLGDGIAVQDGECGGVDRLAREALPTIAVGDGMCGEAMTGAVAET